MFEERTALEAIHKTLKMECHKVPVDFFMHSGDKTNLYSKSTQTRDDINLAGLGRNSFQFHLVDTKFYIFQCNSLF